MISRCRRMFPKLIFKKAVLWLILITIFFLLPQSPSFAYPANLAECDYYNGIWQTGICYVPPTYGITASADNIPALTTLVQTFRSSVFLSIYPTVWMVVIIRKIYFV